MRPLIIHTVDSWSVANSIVDLAREALGAGERVEGVSAVLAAPALPFLSAPLFPAGIMRHLGYAPHHSLRRIFMQHHKI